MEQKIITQSSDSFIEQRKKSMEWWNNLPDVTITTEINKSALCKKYYGDTRIHKSLTGREIQNIWTKENETNN